MECSPEFPNEEAFEVERDVGEDDVCPGPLDADRADEQAAVLLWGKEVLDRGAHFGAGTIGAHQRFAEPPDRLRVGRVVAIVEAELGERARIPDVS